MGLPLRLATIDIGTNSVLLTVVERTADGSFNTLEEQAHITRIGEGLGTNPGFVAPAMERTTQRLDTYVQRCRELEVDQIIAVGTAAFRRASNAKDYVAQVKQDIGLEIEIISGAREAELSYRAATKDFGDDLLVVDIGGGSTEFIWQKEAVIARSDSDAANSRLNALSLPLGSVVLHERLVDSDPISDTDFVALQTFILSELLNIQGSRWGGGAGILQQDVPNKLVALAGSATTLAAMQLQLATYSHAEVHGTVLSEAQLAAQVDQLRGLSVEQRKQVPGIEPARADVILEGAMLLHETMKLFGYDQVTISDRGVRWGLIYERLTA